MHSIDITNAGKNLYRIVENVNMNRKPIETARKSYNAVIVGEEDWRDI